MFRFRFRSKEPQHRFPRAAAGPADPNATAVPGRAMSDPRAMLILLNSYGVCFTLRDRLTPAELLRVVGPQFRKMLTPGSDFHFVGGPADQRCIVQVLDLGGESLVAAVCTGKNASNQSMLWVINNIADPFEAASNANGTRYGLVSSGQFDDEDADLPALIPGARVAPIATL